MNLSTVPLVVVALVLSLIPLYMMSWAAHQCAILWLLHREGLNVDAEITDLQWKIRRAVVYYVVYRFPLPTGDIIHEQLISRRHYKSLKTKRSVSVKYLPKHPHLSRLAGSDKDNFNRNGAIWVSLFLGLVLPPLGLVWLIIFAATIIFSSR
jgi:hypothetical protein